MYKRWRLPVRGVLLTNEDWFSNQSKSLLLYQEINLKESIMKKLAKVFISSMFVSILALSALESKAHCEIPCGIYGDSVRIALIYEHIETVEKSMNMINEISEAGEPE